MIRNYYAQLLLRLIALVLIAFLVCYTWMANGHILLVGALFLAMIIIFFNTLRYLRKTDRKLLYFFEAIKNDDHTIRFSSDTGDRTLDTLSDRLNGLNARIQEVRIANQQQDQYLKVLLEHAATGIMAFDRKGFIVHCNSSVRKIFGLEVFTHIRQLDRVNEQLYSAVKSIKPEEQKLVSLQQGTGLVQILLKASYFESAGDAYYIVSAQDIRNELDEKETDAWIKLIRVMMHEIMNTITPITTLSESLSQYLVKDAEPIKPSELEQGSVDVVVKGLKVIAGQGQGLIRFVESYRKLTKLPKPDKSLFKIEDLFIRISALFKSIPGNETIPVSLKINPSGMELFADEGMISQVIVNLVKNAYEAGEGDPGLRIQLSAALNQGNRPEIIVTDNGPGIKPELIEQIFIPFFSTKENGSGIGLSISRQIMRLHGGSLNVFSEPGKETVFTMSF